MSSRILLADDSLTIRKVVELTFSGGEFELKAVGNGDEAVALLSEFEPDIVLADAVMPGRTGYEVCEEVKRRPGGRFVPVVLLTGTFEPFDKPRSERVGADSVVTKPFDSQGLATLVRDLVRRAAEARASAPPEPPPVPEPPPPPPPASEAAESTDPTLAGSEPFYTAPMASAAAPPAPQPAPGDDIFSTTAIPIFTEIEPPPPPPPPPPARAEFDVPTEPLPPVPPPPPRLDAGAGVPGYEMDLGGLDDVPEPQRRDLDEDIAAFERSDRGKTRRPEAWETLVASAAPAEPAAAPAPDPGHSDLEALAAEASLTDLKSLIPDVGTVAVPAGSRVGPLSDEDIDRIARRVLELGGERVVRRIAWDVVPELAERLVKERLEELEKAD
ncbi:MAG TPA: response regulator [Thermoanaerobaculia bacterium]|nr:response regulator [Thermoanaerobaculia bacterium]